MKTYAPTDHIVVKAHHAGLFSNINKVISYMELHPYVTVDWRSPECIYGTHLDGNIWEHLFMSHSETMMLRPSQGTIIEEVEYPHDRYTFKNVAELYQGDPSWRYRLNAQWHKLKARPRILSASKSDRFIWHPYFTVMVRANSHAGEQTTGKSQSLDAYANVMQTLEEKHKNASFYLMCGDYKTAEWFMERFPNNLHMKQDINRAATRDTDRHLSEPQTVVDAMRCLIEVMIASGGEGLIHPVSNMATAALCMNPNLKSFYIP
jgi:hypothetical protein